MGLISWLAGKLQGSVKVSGEGWRDDDALMSELYTEACFRELALWSAIDLIARAMSKCELKCYENNAETRGAEWYRWNVEPNKNQNSSAFMRRLVSALYLHRECLVVEHGGQLLVADSFTRQKYVMFDDVFTDVKIDDFTFSRTFTGNEVLYWSLDSLGDGKSVQTIIQLVGESYAKLLAYSMKAYQTSRGSKAIFKYESLPEHVKREEANEWLQGQMQKFKNFISGDNGITTIGKGTDLEPYGGRDGRLASETTRDIRHLVDDISDFTAKAFGIPPALLRGDVQGTSDAMKHFLTFCIDPLADMLREEIVRKRIGEKGLAAGYDFIIDTRTIEHISLLEVHDAVSKLIASGAFCVNDIRKLLGESIIDEPWAWKHFLTRNNMSFEEAVSKGGESE